MTPTTTATDEYAVLAALESEAHLRACNVCFLETPEDACPEGKRLETRALTLAGGDLS